ncbi:MAG TPA: hypothetical protein VEG34_00255 [Thermoanaerobaculia bacterium]|nr:hypothetical protein [Thermoanaerobaculia bacterium]
MSSIGTSTFLRRALVADAAISGATSLLMILGAEALQGLLGLPAALSRSAGLVLLPFVALLVWLATRERAPRAGVWTVIEINALWVIGSLLLVLSGWVALTGLGSAFVLLQAVAVAGFAAVQYVGLRRAAARI